MEREQEPKSFPKCVSSGGTPQSELHLLRLTSLPSAAASLPAFTATPEFMVPKLMAFPETVFQRETARETRLSSGSSCFCNPHTLLAAHPRLRELNPAGFSYLIHTRDHSIHTFPEPAGDSGSSSSAAL